MKEEECLNFDILVQINRLWHQAGMHQGQSVLDQWDKHPLASGDVIQEAYLLQNKLATVTSDPSLPHTCVGYLSVYDTGR